MGCPDVDGMLESISSRQLTEWIEFYKSDPWDQGRDDLRAGIVAATIANSMGNKKRGKAFTPADFMPRFDGKPAPRKRKTLEDLKEMVLGLGLKLLKK